MPKITIENRQQLMLQAPLRKIIPQLAVPTVISMLVTSVYSMADTFFVSRISTEASGAVGIVFSAMSIIQALAFTIGMGSGTNLSQCLGAGKDEEAGKYVSVAFFTAFALGLVLMTVCNLNLEGLVRFLGATEGIAPDAMAYASYIFYSAPFMMTSFVMNNLLRFQGMASYAMVGITTGGILNIALDPLFIFALNLGTAGAAIATAISQLVSFLILLFMCNTRRDTISVSFRNFRPTLKMYGRILHHGVPSLGRQGIASVATIILNRVAGGVATDPAVVNAAIASISIVNRFVMFINSAVIGFGQGFQPVCSYCFGAGRYSRVREAYSYCGRVATLILVALAGLALIFSEDIIRLFRAEDPEVVRIGTFMLRCQLCTLPLWGFYVMANMCTQSMGYGFLSTIISSARQGFFLITFVLILTSLFGLTGLEIAQPVADVAAFILAIILMRGIMRHLKELPDKELPDRKR